MKIIAIVFIIQTAFLRKEQKKVEPKSKSNNLVSETHLPRLKVIIINQVSKGSDQYDIDYHFNADTEYGGKSSDSEDYDENG